ncbi:MAG: type II toxin-antitoxin system Phd/YefM family antitoxin [Chloroflexi bacterium]|nr:type II toxin-antitoxin system Phd/YefM family antitoxin [Chloroflexota bacterium]MDA8186733.1 type II toxin-antitoxin system Phd/YefM family antitoxin [Dehalococcoidales bacterium]
MEKTIGAFAVRRQLGKVLQEVVAKGDRYVVERHGEPIAAVVPIEVYDQWKKARDDFFDRLRVISEEANMTPEEADKLAKEAVRQVRRGS